jgi:hypothetical protein
VSAESPLVSCAGLKLAAMRTWFRIALATVIVAALSGIVWQAMRSREPVCRGKTLSGWLEQYDRSVGLDPFMLMDGPERVSVTERGVQRPSVTSGVRSFNPTGPGSVPNPALREEAEQAIRQIGTNAIPQLLALISVEDSPVKAFIVNHLPIAGKLMESLKLGKTYWRWTAKSMSGPWEGFIGFKVLGKQAKPAVPGLIHVIRVSRNHNGRKAATAALGLIGPAAQEAVPTLIENLNDPDSWVRIATVFALRSICRDPHKTHHFRTECCQVMLPLLNKLLHDPRSDKRTIKSLLGEAGDPRFELPASVWSQ